MEVDDDARRRSTCPCWSRAPARPGWRRRSRSPGSASRRCSSSAGAELSGAAPRDRGEPRSMELLRSWGLEDEVRAGGVDVEWLGGSARRWRRRRPASAFAVGLPTREQSAVLSPTAPACVPQDHLEPVLLEHLRVARRRARAARHRGGRRRDGADGVEVVLRDLASGAAADACAPATWSPPTARTAGPRPRSASPCAGPTGSATPSRRCSGRRCGRSLGEHRYGIYSVSDPRRRGHLPARRPRRPLAVRRRWDARTRAARRTTRPSGSCERIRAGAGVADLDAADRAHRRLQLRRPARRPLPRRRTCSSSATPPTG